MSGGVLKFWGERLRDVFYFDYFVYGEGSRGRGVLRNCRIDKYFYCDSIMKNWFWGMRIDNEQFLSVCMGLLSQVKRCIKRGRREDSTRFGTQLRQRLSRYTRQGCMRHVILCSEVLRCAVVALHCRSSADTR